MRRRVEFVDARLDFPHLRAERFGRYLEPAPGLLASFHRLDRERVGTRGQVPCHRVEDVRGDDLGGMAPLHLERPEAVEGADVEAALALPRDRKRQLLEQRTMVEEARRLDARSQFERVVPLA